MVTRTRDRKREYKPQEIIKFEEWEMIMDRYNRAVAFMDESNPLFVLMRDSLKEAEEIVLTNRVHEVREFRVITDIIQKIFITSKEEQMNELVGQIKYIREYLMELQIWVEQKVELEQLEQAGKVVIKRNKPVVDAQG